MKSTRFNFCIVFVTGSPGSGKSYLCAKEVVERLEEHTGPIVTNLPLALEAIADEVAERFGRDREEVLGQFVMLDQEKLSRWQKGGGGPWDFAEGGKLPAELQGADFILDECHRFARKGDRGRQASWGNWLGEVRHEGWRRVVFVTQDEGKVSPAITMHAESRFELTNTELEREPFFGSRLILWYELIASFTGKWASRVKVLEFRRKKGKLREESTETFALEASGFKRYESHVAAGGGTASGASKFSREYQRRPRWWWAPRAEGVEGRFPWSGRLAPTWFWAGIRMAPSALPRLALVFFVGWICFGGGAVKLMGSYMGALPGYIESQGGPTDELTPGLEPAPGDAAESAELDPEAAAAAIPIEEETDSERAARFREAGAGLFKLARELPEEKRADVVFFLEELQAVAERQQTRIDALEEELGRLPEEVQTQIFALSHSGVVLSDAGFVGIGRKVYGGGLDGRILRSVDLKQRMAEFDDGTLIRVGVGVLYPEKPASEGGGPTLATTGSGPRRASPSSPTGVPGGVRAGVDGGGRVERSVLVNRRSESVGGSTPVGGAGEVSGGHDGPVDHHGRRPGTTGDNARSE